MMLCFTAFADLPEVRPMVLVLHGGNVGTDHPSFVTALETLKRYRIAHEIDAIDANIRYREGNKGRYAAIFMSDYKAYAHLSRMLRERMHQYALDFGVGFFYLYVHHFDRMNDGQLYSGNHTEFTNLRVSPDTTMPRILKPGVVGVTGTLKGRYIRIQELKGYEAVALANMGGIVVNTVVRDLGNFDGIKRAFFGPDFIDDWLFDLLLLDCVQWLSPVELPLPLTRYLGVDIDDIFQPSASDTQGVKMQAADVEALLASQEALSKDLGEPFRYELGFNSNWFEKSVATDAALEIAGDRAFITNRSAFDWFDHLPGHEISTEHSQQSLENLMMKSKHFAESVGLTPYIRKYHVAPKHQGVYPTYDPLFLAWKKIWGAEATSTLTIQTGFHHNGIAVVPRFDLALEWNAHSWTQVDKAKLEAQARGGYLFEGLLQNPVSLFMTHQANYARDRLGLHAVHELIRFTRESTHIKLVPKPGDELVRKYFELFPNLPPKPINSSLSLQTHHCH